MGGSFQVNKQNIESVPLLILWVVSSNKDGEFSYFALTTFNQVVSVQNLNLTLHSFINCNGKHDTASFKLLIVQINIFSLRLDNIT